MVAPWKVLRNLDAYVDTSLQYKEINDSIYHTNVPSHEMHNDVYMIGCAFGNAQTTATRRLAHNAGDLRMYTRRDIPLFAQYAILKNMRQMLPEDYEVDNRSIGELVGDVPLTTRQVLERVHEHVHNLYGREGLSRGIMIAHPALMQRAVWMAEKLDFKVQPFVDAESIWNTNQESLDAGATVSKEVWKSYERKVRIHHFVRGWI